MLIRQRTFVTVTLLTLVSIVLLFLRIKLILPWIFTLDDAVIDLSSLYTIFWDFEARQAFDMRLTC